jgi:hypothetical protein
LGLKVTAQARNFNCLVRNIPASRHRAGGPENQAGDSNRASAMHPDQQQGQRAAMSTNEPAPAEPGTHEAGIP